jgi:hypothetical protein
VAGPSRVEPSRVEPVEVGLTAVQPSKVESTKSLPTRTDFTDAEWTKSEAGKAEPAGPRLASGEAVKNGPAGGEVDRVEPVVARFAASEAAKSDLAVGKDDKVEAATTGSGRNEPGGVAGNRPTVPASRPAPAAPTVERHIAEQRVDDDRFTPDAEDKPKAESASKTYEPTPAEAAGRAVPDARHSNYAEEAAELLAAPSANRKRRQTAAGLPAGDPATEEPPITVTRLPRKGQPKPAKD